MIPECEKAKKKAYKEQKSACLFILGDVFDDRKNLNLMVNDFAITSFYKIAQVIPTVILSGNHDLYRKTNTGVTSLKSLM